MLAFPWPAWDEVEAGLKAAGRVNEAAVAAHRARFRAEQRAWKLAEIRKSHGLSQTALASLMQVSQRRVSAVEHGDLDRTHLGTVSAYVEALGGKVEVVARFPDQTVIIG